MTLMKRNLVSCCPASQKKLRLHFGVNIGDLYPDVVNLWDTNLPGKISLNVFVSFLEGHVK